MHPSHQQTAGARGTSTNTKTSTEKEVLLKERALKRAEASKSRRVKAEEHHKTGNAHFLEGEYHDAIAEYEVAIKVHGPTAIYLSNMAAAWLKLEAYDPAEQCASRALILDPRFFKARFRRGQARKGNLQLAAAGIDFATVLKQVPNSTETKNALNEICLLLRERNHNDPVEPTECGPSLTDPTVELESVSDSSDWNHEGNGFPCPYYNHDGCTRGAECESSHAPDHKSVRDNLGRNVCVRYLLDDCFGRCVYSHEKTYLPSGRWWESGEKQAEVRKILGWTMIRQDPDILPKLLAGIDGRLAWKPAHVWRDDIVLPEGFGDTTGDLECAIYLTRGRGIGGPGRGRRGDRHSEPELDSFEERMANWGFTEDEANLEEVCWCDGIPGRWFEDDGYDVFVGVQPL